MSRRGGGQGALRRKIERKAAARGEAFDHDFFNGCGRKRKYDTQEAAERTVAQLKAEKPQQNASAPLNAYQCQYCRRWHIGKRKYPQAGEER